MPTTAKRKTKKYKLCTDCGQPMLPKGVKKKPDEYDHAQGCPQAKEKTMTQESKTPSPELQERALEFLKEFCGLNESGIVGDSITVLCSHKGSEVGYWIIDSQGNKRRFKELLAAFAEWLAPSIETAPPDRQQFENWCIEKMLCDPEHLERLTAGPYRLHNVQCWWMGWQAAIAPIPSPLPAPNPLHMCGECGHGVALHEWEDENHSSCLAATNGSFGTKNAAPCMCPGYKAPASTSPSPRPRTESISGLQLDGSLDPFHHAVKLAESERKFKEHTEHVKQFLNDMYATMIDPCAEGEIKVADMCAALLNAAREQREQLNRPSVSGARCPRCKKGTSLVLRDYEDGLRLACGANCGLIVNVNAETGLEFDLESFRQFFSSPPDANSAGLARLRADGWSVSMHNDYKRNGESFTFWLLSKGDLRVKGAGRTDEEALAVIQSILENR